MSNPAVLRPHVLDAIVFNMLSRIVEQLNTEGDREFVLVTSTEKILSKNPDRINIVERVTEVPVDPFANTLASKNVESFFSWSTEHNPEQFQGLGLKKKFFFSNAEEKDSWILDLQTRLTKRVKNSIMKSETKN